MSNTIDWDDNVQSALKELLTGIGMVKSQTGRLIDEIDKSLAWNDEQPEIYSDDDRVVFDGPLDEETCLWEPPTPAPTTGQFIWDEASVSWLEN